MKGRAYETCSVVSTSGTLLLHKDGVVIDAADAVIRLGWGPVDGFEQHVGHRQTLRMTSTGFLEEERHVSPASVHSVLREMPNRSKVAFITLDGDHWRQCSPALGQLAPCHPHVGLVRLPLPSLLLQGANECLNWRPRRRDVDASLAQSPPDLPRSLPLAPTTGFVAIYALIAYGICEKVRLWGMVDRSKIARAQYDNTSYHYFQAGTADGPEANGDEKLAIKYQHYTDVAKHRPGTHDFTIEHSWLLAYGREPMRESDGRGRMIELSLRDMQRGCPRALLSEQSHLHGQQLVPWLKHQGRNRTCEPGYFDWLPYCGGNNAEGRPIMVGLEGTNHTNPG